MTSADKKIGIISTCLSTSKYTTPSCLVILNWLLVAQQAIVWSEVKRTCSNIPHNFMKFYVPSLNHSSSSF